MFFHPSDEPHLWLSDVFHDYQVQILLESIKNMKILIIAAAN